MKAPDFDYIRADSLDVVFEAFETHGEEAQILAGGQSLMATLNLRLSAPAALIDINNIGRLAGIAPTPDGGLRVGALTRHAAMADPLVAERAPLLAMALPHIAHPAIRNRGTVGGSVALADPAAEWPACMVALGAGIELTGKDGPRTVPADDFFLGLYDTARRPDEILTALILPPADGRRFGFAEFARRDGDFAIVGVAASTAVSAGRFEDLRLVVFGSESHPRAAPSVRAGGAIDDIVAALQNDLDPMPNLQGSAAYKTHLAGVLARRVLTAMAEAA